MNIVIVAIVVSSSVFCALAAPNQAKSSNADDKNSRPTKPWEYVLNCPVFAMEEVSIELRKFIDLDSLEHTFNSSSSNIIEGYRCTNIVGEVIISYKIINENLDKDLIREKTWPMCEQSCILQIERDFLLPGMKLINNTLSTDKVFVNRGSYRGLNCAWDAANEWPKVCASEIGIDINCSFKSYTEQSKENYERMAIWMAIHGSMIKNRRPYDFDSLSSAFKMQVYYMTLGS